ncbi:MAG TPA: MBL fold metallo-hydrolase [Aldersonia sp.]
MDVFTDQAPEQGWLPGVDLSGSIRWTGCAGFVVDVADERICIDPFVSNPGPRAALFRPARPDVALVRNTFGDPAAVFIGHSHWDHAMDVAVLAHAGRTVAHGSSTTAELCRRQAVPTCRIVTVADGTRVGVGPFTVEAVASRHGIVPIAGRIDRIELTGSGMPRTPFRWPRGAVFSYRVEVGRHSIYFHTSAGIEDGPLARQQPVDVLVACLAARQGTPNYLDRLAEQLRPTVLIPCHHDNFLRPVHAPPRPVARLDWRGFLADAARLHERYGTRLVRLPRGVTVRF